MRKSLRATFLGKRGRIRFTTLCPKLLVFILEGGVQGGVWVWGDLGSSGSTSCVISRTIHPHFGSVILREETGRLQGSL